MDEASPTAPLGGSAASAFPALRREKAAIGLQ
jgi:hypothetical protein